MESGIVFHKDGGFTAIGEQATKIVRLTAIKVALTDEINQVQKYGNVQIRLARGIMATTRVRREFGFTGNRVEQLRQLNELIARESGSTTVTLAGTLS